MIPDPKQTIKDAGYVVIEGSSSPEQIRWFREYLRHHPEIKRICEIGFNEGCGSHTFLTARDDITVVSFDINWYPYSKLAEQYLLSHFPNRLQVIWGDSRETIPNFCSDEKFDLIFIDGGHHYDVSKSDITESASMAHSKTVIVMDDLTPWVVWGQGPTRAWYDAIREGKVEELEVIGDGKTIAENDSTRYQRIWALGRYALKALL